MALFFSFNRRGIKQESERQRVGERKTERGDARREEKGREGEREAGGARNEKLRGGKKQHSKAQVAERAHHSRGPEPSGCCAREPGPAPPSWGPRGPRPLGGGGEDQLGSRRSPALPRAPSQGAPQPRPDGGSGARLAEAASKRRRCSPGLGESANIFQTTQTFPLSQLSGVSLGWNCSVDSRGAPGAIPPRCSSVARLTSRTRGPVALAPRSSQPALLPGSGKPRLGSVASGRAPIRAPLDPALEPPATAARLETAD